MGSYTLIKNSYTEINLREDARDNGWVISGSKAIHSGCNQGPIKLISANYVAGQPNVFKYKVSGYSSGLVYLRVGDQVGPDVMADGEQTVILTPAEGDEVSFYSDGNLTVEILSIFTETSASNGTTLWFDEKLNKWVAEVKYEPDMMLKFMNSFYSFKDGALWEHNSDEVDRNTFYGVFHPSELVFYVNVMPGQDKNFFSMEIESNEVWFSPEDGDIKIYPTKGKKDGMISRLKKGRFRRLNNYWFADFLRNVVDPRFTNQDLALFNGAELQGDVMEVRIINTDTTEVRLQSVLITVAKQNFSF